jgi:hypothetical protein
VFEEAPSPGRTLLADLDSDGGSSSSAPVSHSEDDDGRMLRAMRRFVDSNPPLPVQVGVNRGHVFAAEVGSPTRAAFSAMGDTTNTAARIMSKAPVGAIYAHPAVLENSRTLFATTPAGPFPMKGKAVPLLVYDVREESGTRESQARTELEARRPRRGSPAARRCSAPSAARAASSPSPRTGLGKSRLISEAMRGLEATVVPVRAEPYGMTSPYRMLRDPVRRAFGIDRGDPAEMAALLLERFRLLMPDLLPLAPLLSDVVNVPLPATPESAAIEPRYRPDRIADIVVRLLEVAVRGPLVVLVEEAHWSDGASTTVLSRVARACEGRPWAVVVVRRDEGEGFAPEEGLHVLLEPLTDEVMTRIVTLATENQPLLEHEIAGIVARSGGNPLYAEELIRLFREVGSLEEMPESLHAALDAQIDALDAHSRRVLRYASVLGRSFRREVLNQTLRGDDLVVDEATVEALSGFLESDGPARLRFRTGMIRDAAYEGLAYRLRTRLHAAAGRAVETLSTDLEADADTLALHFWRGGDSARTWRYAHAGDRARAPTRTSTRSVRARAAAVKDLPGSAAGRSTSGAAGRVRTAGAHRRDRGVERRAAPGAGRTRSHHQPRGHPILRRLLPGARDLAEGARGRLRRARRLGVRLRALRASLPGVAAGPGPPGRLRSPGPRGRRRRGLEPRCSSPTPAASNSATPTSGRAGGARVGDRARPLSRATLAPRTWAFAFFAGRWGGALGGGQRLALGQ